MFCRNCGKEIEDETKEYCPNCDKEFNQNIGRNWLYALMLNWLLGCCGVHRFYTGYIGIGVAQLLTFGGLGIWSLVDMISLGINKFKNADGEELEGFIKPIGLMGIAYALMVILLVLCLITLIISLVLFRIYNMNQEI